MRARWLLPATLTPAWPKTQGRPPQSFLELACGPGTHAVEAARRGLVTAALDSSTRMVARAQGNARRAGVPVAVVVRTCPAQLISGWRRACTGAS